MFCPKCGKENKDGAKFCVGCGSALPGLQKDETVQSSQAYNDAEKYNTSEEVPHGGNIFAENPDRSLPPGVNPNQNGTSKKNSGKKKWIFIGAGAAALVIVVIAIILIFAGRGSVSEVEETQDEEYLEAAENYGEVNACLIEIAESIEDEDMTTDEKAQLYLDALSELEEEGLIQESSVVYDESISEISYNYADGAGGGILLEEIEEGTSGYGTDSYITSYNDDGYAATVTNDPVSFDIEGSPYEEGELNGFAVWGLGDGYEDELEVMEGSVINWNKAYLTTQIDYDFTLNEMRTALSGYDFVVIQLHGYAGCGYPVLDEAVSWADAAFYTSDEAIDLLLTEEEIATIEDLQSGRVEMKLTSLNGWSTFNYIICPDFFAYYYGDGGLEDTIVWLGCCDGYLYDDLVDSVYDCGADAVLACTESVITYYNIFCLDAFVYSLLYGNTVDESLSLAQSAYGANDNIFAQVFLGKIDDTPSEIRYCEGSADATLATLTQEAQAAADTEAENIFAELPDTFTFTSGAGAWATELYINDDGTFTGYYHDSDMGDTGDGYSGGKMYICEFSGKFTDPVQIDEYTYSMELEYINIETEGDSYIEDEILYIPSDPYGMDDADEFLIYLPGSVLSELPEEFLDWFYLGSIARTTIPSGVYGLYNVSGMEGFTGETEDSIWGSDFEYGYGDNYSVMTPYYYCPSHIAFYDGTNEYGAIYLTFTWEEDDQTVFSASDSRGSGDYEIEIILNEEKTAAQITVISLDGVDLSAYGGTSDGTLSAEYLLTQ